MRPTHAGSGGGGVPHAVLASSLSARRLSLARLTPLPLAAQGSLHAAVRRPFRPPLPVSRVPPHVLLANVSTRLPAAQTTAASRALQGLRFEVHHATECSHPGLHASYRGSPLGAPRPALPCIPHADARASASKWRSRRRLPIGRAGDLRAQPAPQARDGAGAHRAQELLHRARRLRALARSRRTLAAVAQEEGTARAARRQAPERLARRGTRELRSDGSRALFHRAGRGADRSQVDV